MTLFIYRSCELYGLQIEQNYAVSIYNLNFNIKYRYDTYVTTLNFFFKVRPNTDIFELFCCIFLFFQQFSEGWHDFLAQILVSLSDAHIAPWSSEFLLQPAKESDYSIENIALELFRDNIAQ